MSKKEQKIYNEIKKIVLLLNHGKSLEAFNALQTLEKKHPKSHTVQFNKVSLLIDCGNDLKDARIVTNGIITGEKLIYESQYREHEALLYYNLANGYSALYKLCWDYSGGLEQTLDNENLQKAKMYYRKAIEQIHNPTFLSRKELLTNYGHCFTNLGRNLEALYYYDEALKIEPTFGMALGNYATTIMNFASISGAYRAAICVDAYNKLKSALSDPTLLPSHGIFAKKHFENKLREIEDYLCRNNILLTKVPHKRYSKKGLSDFEKVYLDICSHNRLFLNFHVHDGTCEGAIVDPVCISIVVSVEDDDTFYELSKYVNQIKEDFAVARLLFVQAQYERKDYNRICKRTKYVYSLDYSMFNLYGGLLKSAFTQAYNILDKIAVFINEYYNLEMNPKQIYFTNVWQKKETKTVLEASENLALFALYDIYLDFRSGYYKRIKDIRNAITHRRLVMYDSTCTVEWEEKEHDCNIGYESMLSETTHLLQLVRSAIIYMVNAIEIQERGKREDTKGVVPLMYVDTEQYLPPFEY